MNGIIIMNDEPLIWIVIYLFMVEEPTNMGLIFIIGGIIAVVAVVISIIIVERKEDH